MKEFVYLDSSFLHSFIAQIYGGLPSNVTNETQESRTETHTDSKQKEILSEIQGSINAVIANMGTKITPKETRAESLSLAQLEVGKEIISKQLHDNAVDELIEHLRENDLLIDSRAEINLNKYVLYRSPFKIIDLEYLKIFTRKEFSKLLGLNKLNIHSGNKQSGNDQHGGISIDQIGKILDLFSEIMPSDIFIKQDEILSPLKKEYLRVQPKELLFKYSDKTNICLLGKVTKEIDSSIKLEDFQFTNLLSISDIMMGLASGLMAQFEVINVGDYIVSPIAIFFESI